MGPWTKDSKQMEIGTYMQVEQIQAMPSYPQALLSRIVCWQKREINILLAHVTSEIKDKSIYQYSKMYVVYGWKHILITLPFKLSLYLVFKSRKQS
jgi:hypothetical protein